MKNWTIEEINNKINELKKEIFELSQLMYKCGNKQPQNNFLIKDRLALIEELKKELKER